MLFKYLNVIVVTCSFLFFDLSRSANAWDLQRRSAAAIYIDEVLYPELVARGKDRLLIHTSNDFDKTQYSGTIDAEGMTDEQQRKKTEQLYNAMDSHFQDKKQKALEQTTGADRKAWGKKKTPMMDTIRKDGELHFSSSYSGSTPPDHHPKTNAIINSCGGSNAHNSGGRCAEQGAMDQYFKNNPKGDIKGGKSLAWGKTVDNPTAGPQEACKGRNGRKGCEDHLKAAGVDDIANKAPEQKPDGKKKEQGQNKKFKPLDLSGVPNTPGKETKNKLPLASSEPPKLNDKNFPALPGQQPKPAAEQPKKSYADAVKTPPKESKPKTNTMTVLGGGKKRYRRNLREHPRDW